MSSNTVAAKNSSQLYGREQLPGRLSVPQRAADKLLATKKIKSFKIGRRRVCSEQAILDFIRRQESGK